MPTYLYKAKQGPQKSIEGELVAESRAAAVAAVDAMGYHPVWVREKTAEDGARRRLLKVRRVTRRDVTVFTRQLAGLIRSGVPILRALLTLAEQTEKRAFRRVIEHIEHAIRDGKMLSESLSAFPTLFSELYVNMVRAGESGGILDHVLERLADAREKEEDTRRRVQAAVAYPTLVLIVGVVTVFVLFSFFLPRVAELFEGYGKLPMPTLILIGISRFFSDYWYWMVFGVLLVLALFNRLAAMEKGRGLVDTMKLRTLFLGRFIRDVGIARCARTLALLIDAGIPIDKALALSGDTLNNAVMRDELDTVRRDTVQQGMRLSEGLKRARYFPPFVANMAAVGEEAGRLDEALGEVALFYEKEVEQRSRLATSLLEPVLILVVGLIVGFIVAAMLLPIFELSTRI